jgi:hypothetical protein
MDTITAQNDDTVLADDRWICAFCGRVAVLETVPRPLCESRRCACGAVALANRPCDFDEITDDVIGLFAVKVRPESCGYEQALRQDILRSGVEIKSGAVGERELLPGHREPLHYIWFRRQGRSNHDGFQQGNPGLVRDGRTVGRPHSL